MATSSFSVTKAWQLQPTAPADFLTACGEHPVLLQVLYNRGLRTPQQTRTFLDSGVAQLSDPLRLRDMDRAIDRILEAIRRQQVICVYGDYDADGVTATALLVGALQLAGARAGPYIPERVEEGYGLNDDAVRRIAQKAQLLVTVDCGIRSVVEVVLANQLGMEVIVTDHHTPGAQLPPALAVINPRRSDCDSPFKDLAGVGVAYRLAQALFQAALQRPESSLDRETVERFEEALLELVAIGTVADMLPLVGENRFLVRQGLAGLNRTRRPGLQALFQTASLATGAVDATAIGFRLGPRINAAGRLEHAKVAYDLLRTADPLQAQRLAAQLDEINLRRQTLTAQAQREAEKQMQPQIEANAPLFSVAHPSFRSGIVGLVAGRLAERYYRPVVVIEEGAVESRGSARSISEFDITAALDEIAADGERSNPFVRYGGHSMAAGFTIRSDRLPDFQAALGTIAERELGQQLSCLRPTLVIDALVPPGEVDRALHGQLMRLEPTGRGNPPARLLFPACRVRSLRAVGQGGTHLKLEVEGQTPQGGSRVLDAIAFGQGHRAGDCAVGEHLDLVGQIELNQWMGENRLQLVVEDLRPAVHTWEVV